MWVEGGNKMTNRERAVSEQKQIRASARKQLRTLRKELSQGPPKDLGGFKFRIGVARAQLIRGSRPEVHPEVHLRAAVGS